MFPHSAAMRSLTVLFVSSALFAACGSQQAPAKADGADAKAEAAGDAEDAPAAGASLHTGADPGGECLHDKGPTGDCAPAAQPETPEGHFGAPFALQESKPLTSVIETLATVGQDPVQVTGEVSSVCQKMGCWMVIKDGETQARVLMKDHSFAVPFDGTGKKAVVEGTIEAKELSEGQVKHIEEDAGRDPSKVSGPRNEYVLTASGVRLDS